MKMNSTLKKILQEDNIKIKKIMCIYNIKNLKLGFKEIKFYITIINNIITTINKIRKEIMKMHFWRILIIIETLLIIRAA